MKVQPITLSPAMFESLFPFHLAFDRNMTITQVGSVLGRVCATIRAGDSLSQHFVLQRPAIELKFDSVRAATRNLFILKNVSTGLVLRGQVVYLEENDVLLLLGNPWVAGVGTLSAYGLSVGDFPLGDPIVDLLQVIQLQENTLLDLRALNEILGEQKRALRQANAKLLEQFKSLERAQALSQSILDTAPDAIITIRQDGVIEVANPAAEALFGYSAGELIGLDVSLLMPSPDGNLHSSYIKRYLETGVPRILGRGREVVGLRKSGEQFPLYLSVGKAQISDQMIFTGILHDISAVKETEAALIAARQAAEEATLAKSQFLANMSHEIRTPMNAVIGMTTILKDTSLTIEQRQFVETIESSGNTMLGIVSDILDFSKIESGAFELHEREFELTDSIGIVLNLVAPKAARKGLEIASRLDPSVPISVLGDENRLRQILLNLLNNAIKFTDHGEIILTVKTLERTDSWVEFQFSVSDTGIGVPVSHVERLFKAFSQIDSSAARRFEGTGLGLAISRKLVELMNGKIWADSVEGKGSTFHFTAKLGCVGTRTIGDISKQERSREPQPVLVFGSGGEAHAIQIEDLESIGFVPTVVETLDALERSVKAEPSFRAWIINTELPTEWTALRNRMKSQSPPRKVILLTSLSDQSRRTADLITQQLQGLVTVDRILKPCSPALLLEHLTEEDRSESQRALLPSGTSSIDRNLAEELPLRILVVEDNPINQQVVLFLLKRMRFEADIVSSGSEAVEAVLAKSYDVIFMDLQMPGMDGFEASDRIRKHFGNPVRPWIVAMTADVTQGTYERCLAAGMNDYVSKPVRPEILQASLLRLGQSLGEGG